MSELEWTYDDEARVLRYTYVPQPYEAEKFGGSREAYAREQLELQSQLKQNAYDSLSRRAVEMREQMAREQFFGPYEQPVRSTVFQRLRMKIAGWLLKVFARM